MIDKNENIANIFCSQESARISAPNVEGHTQKACVSHIKISWKNTALECATCVVSSFTLLSK